MRKENVRLRVRVAHKAEKELDRLSMLSGRGKGETLDTVLRRCLPFLRSELIGFGACRFPSQRIKMAKAVMATKQGLRRSYSISLSTKIILKEAVENSRYNMGEIVTVALTHYRQIRGLRRKDAQARREAVAAYLKGVLLAQKLISFELETMRSRWKEILPLYFTPEKSPAYSELTMFFNILSRCEAYEDTLRAARNRCRREVGIQKAGHSRGRTAARADLERA